MKEKIKHLYKIILEKGYCELASGHMSYRDSANPDIFWMIPLLSHEQISSNNYDLACIDINTGQVLNNLPVNFSGISLHCELYRARPNIMAINHYHGPYTTAFSSLHKPLKICFQESCVLYNDWAFYPHYNGLIDDKTESEQIVNCLGSRNVAILANHGAICVGNSIESIGFRLLVLERLCWMLMRGNYDDINQIGDKIAGQTYKTLTSDNAFELQYNNFIRNYEFSRSIC